MPSKKQLYDLYVLKISINIYQDENSQHVHVWHMWQVYVDVCTQQGRKSFLPIRTIYQAVDGGLII